MKLSFLSVLFCVFLSLKANATSQPCMYLADAAVSVENARRTYEGFNPLNSTEESLLWLESFQACTGMVVIP